MARKTKADALITRQQLIDAAITQFAARGVAKTTLSDIADAAHVTRGAVYWHFDSKEQIFDEIWKQQLQFIHCENIIERHRDPLRHLREKFIRALSSICHDERQRALLEILYCKYEVSNDSLNEIDIQILLGMDEGTIKYWLKLCIQEGYLSAKLDLNATVMLLRCSISGIVRHWLIQRESFDLEKQAPALIESLFHFLVINASEMAL